MSFELPLLRTNTGAVRALREALTTQALDRVGYYALDEIWPTTIDTILSTKQTQESNSP